MSDSEQLPTDPQAAQPEDADLDDPGAGVPPDALTGLRAANESDPYGLELKGSGGVVQSDTAGAAALSAEYTADHATQTTHADPDDTLEAWSQAAKDSEEPTAI